MENQPTNPSIKQYNCEHPGYMCHAPARRFTSGRRVKHFCVDHAPKYRLAGVNKFAPQGVK